MAEYVDLRSDTVTRPTKDMLNAMLKAHVGDDVYGEDPTVNMLEERVADLLGFEAALFTPSGTMANQIAIHCHTRHGDSILTENESHIFLYEAGAAAAQSGVQFDLIPLEDHWSDSSIESNIKPEWLHYASTRLIVVENTHNRASGRVTNLETLKRIHRHSTKHNLSLHCDGARLWNAATALRCHERDLTSVFDSVSVCFSKGLGAPVGSALASSKAMIDRARKIRKRWGGGMRQAGYLAAAAIYALDNNRERLEKDHLHLKQLYDGIEQLAADGLKITTSLPEIWTNILYFNVNNADFLTKNLKDEGILLTHLGHGKIRAVTHLQIDETHIKKTLIALRNALKKAPKQAH